MPVKYRWLCLYLLIIGGAAAGFYKLWARNYEARIVLTGQKVVDTRESIEAVIKVSTDLVELLRRVFSQQRLPGVNWSWPTILGHPAVPDIKSSLCRLIAALRDDCDNFSVTVRDGR